MTLTTAISRADPNGVILRGHKLETLMAERGFAEVVHLALRGSLPDSGTARLVEAILVSAADHGPDAPSIHIARATASCGVPLATAVANGVAAIGTHHGGAGEACARILQEALDGTAADADLGALAAGIVARAIASGGNLPGFGHRVYKDKDPRAVALYALASESGRLGPHARLAELVAEALSRAKGRRLVLNVDGAQAALLSDLGYPWRQVMSLFIIGRTVGLCAHAGEELAGGIPLGYLGASPLESAYSGPEPVDSPPEVSP